MPILAGSSYRPPIWLKGGHPQTMYPTLFRKVMQPDLERIRIDTPDGDFLVLDLGKNGKNSNKLVILSHGLEGNSRRKYIFGMGMAFMRHGWDMLSWNCRFCGGEENLLPRLYHSGDTEDLKVVSNYAVSLGYEKIVLVGFSMGGNQTLKLLGEEGSSLMPEIVAAVAFSVPCDLHESAGVLSAPSNSLYMKYFLHSLRKKVRVKHERYPDLFCLEGLDEIKNFKEFDSKYTAPLHGFSSAEDYWKKASSLQFLPEIKTPTLLVTARNDPFMSDNCYPYEMAKNSRFLYFESPLEGGHTGFTPARGVESGYGKSQKELQGLKVAPGSYWCENRALEFVRDVLGNIEG